MSGNSNTRILCDAKNSITYAYSLESILKLMV